MPHKKIVMMHDKKIALVAHDNMKGDLLEWARFNRELLSHHQLFATGTTGLLLEQQLGLTVHKLQSGPLGGDQQVGAKISSNEIDFLIFFWDPLTPQPHDTDVKALERMAVVWNIPIACNRTTADFMISSPLMVGEYERLIPDYDVYRKRKIDADELEPRADAESAPVEFGEPAPEEASERAAVEVSEPAAVEARLPAPEKPGTGDAASTEEEPAAD